MKSSYPCGFSLGNTYKDFKVTKALPIEELRCTLIELEHMPSGAQVMHIAADDPENVFCLSFKTLPSSSNGAPHILEHTVLCGSQKFPVKDPFFAMTRRSLNTFMNALTGADFTCYPAASLVEKDFYNLLEVYLDAVFHPKLHELSFLQEGHRLAFQKEGDKDSALEYKGIVFNEMKGSLSSPESRMWHEMLKHLTPDLPYAYNSGGDPKDIPSLSYQDLLNFHKTYYHPSRCLFFFYGNLDLKKHLDFIHEKTLSSVVKKDPLPPIPKQKRFQKEKTVHAYYPSIPSEGEPDKDIVCLGWLTTSVDNQEEILALCVLDSILMDTDASLLKYPLSKSGLCVHADAYMDTEMTEVPYVIVFRGCQKDSMDALEQTLRASLEDIIQKGIPDNLINAAMHQLELMRTEIAGDHNPFGLSLFMRSALAKQHGCDPEYSLMVHSLFEKLLEKVKDKEYFPNLIRKHFLNNKHCVRLLMSPKNELAQEELNEEKEKLEKIRKSLDDNQKEEILKTSLALKKYQEMVEHQDIECLPKVTLNDVPKKARDFPLHSFMYEGLHIHHHESFTNHILYADLVFELPSLNKEELQYLALLTTLIPELGAANRGYEQNLEELHAHTGGIHASNSYLSHIENTGAIKPVVVFKGKALERKTKEFFELFYDTVTSCRFDEKERIKELILQIHTALHSKLNKNAMRYATQLALGTLSSAGYLNNLWYGLPYFEFINQLKKNLIKGLDSIVEKLSSLYNKLSQQSVIHLILACDKESFDEMKSQNFYNMAKLPKNRAANSYLFEPNKDKSQARVIASQIAFNVEAFATVTYLNPHSPAILVASQLLDNRVLHSKVREQGGAYGSNAHYTALSGSFYFSSYRDPHISNTFKVFDESLEVLANGNFTDKELEEAKLGIIQVMDAPLPPMSRALSAFTWEQEGRNHAIRQKYRDKLLRLSSEDIKTAVKEALLSQKQGAIRISFAGKSLIEKENNILKSQGKELAVYPL